MATKRQTLEQRRAAAAWNAVEKVTGKTLQTKYGTLARKLPAMIQMNGLGTVLAFLKAKGKNRPDDGHTFIFNHLSAWVLYELNEPRDYADLMQLVREAEMDVYRRATAEAIEYGIWLKRYVEAQDWGSLTEDEA